MKLDSVLIINKLLYSVASARQKYKDSLEKEEERKKVDNKTPYWLTVVSSLFSCWTKARLFMKIVLEIQLLIDCSHFILFYVGLKSNFSDIYFSPVSIRIGLVRIGLVLH